METQQNSCDEQEEVSVLLQNEGSLDIKNTVIDFTTIVEPGGDPCKALYLNLMQDAINDYLWFGIKNKFCVPSVVEFINAFNYLFVTRSYDKSTWFCLDTCRESEEFAAVPTDTQLQLMCFDVHFDFTALGNRIKMPVLLKLLKEKRFSLIEDNFPRLLRKINASKRKYYKFRNKNYRTVNLDKALVIRALTEPTESELIGLYYGNLDESTV